MTSILSSIVGLVERFGRFVSTTEKGARIKFPRTQAKVFCAELGVVLNSFNLGENGGALDQLMTFLTSITISIDTLKGQAGISAMCTFLNVFVSLLTTVLHQEAMIKVLVQQKANLEMKIYSLNAKIDELLSSESMISNNSVEALSEVVQEFSVNDGDANPSETSTLENERIEWIADVISSTGCREIKILTSFVAVPRQGLKTKRLVILYEDLLVDGASWIKPDHPDIIWQCLNDFQDDTESFELFLKFCSENPEAFKNLLNDFFDEKSLALLSQITDTTAMYPSVRLIDGVYVPVLMVAVLSVDYRPADGMDLPAEITTSSGRNVPIVLCDRMILETCSNSITLGCGISSSSMFDECGSIAGIVADSANQKYFLTCEHVLTALESSVPAGDTTLELEVPSVQARKRILTRAVSLESGPVFDSPLDSVVYHSSSPALKAILSVKNDADITLKKVRDFLFDNQDKFSCEIDSMIKFESREISLTPFWNSGTVKITGDIGLIPVPSNLNGKLDFSFQKILQWEDAVRFMTKKQKILVTLHGAASGPPRINGTHEMMSFVHIKQKKITEDSMRYTSSSLFDRTLYGQYMICGNGAFGIPGDSGGLVSIESKNGRQIVGVFVGSVQSNTKYVATPAQMLSLSGYNFVPK